ncbi:hypothetical protein BKA65DRAFT_534818 [Rhexocercosporidium sp. MPI-PUGE-AT-0058]|nr:hypothetical protein BKA65DRAFT_534818 [Rhexocercosporidium sp. MPI-PUGE-AT-0058]
MDPLSVAASTFAIVQIADRIITLCKQYISGVHDAPAELRVIAVEVGSVKCVLEFLELPSADGTSTIQPILEKLRIPIQGCHEAFIALEALFPSDPDVPPHGKRQRLAISLAGLAWPFKRDRASKLIEQIGSYKATIMLGLTAESTQDVKKIRQHVEIIQTSTTTSNFNEVLKWLVTTDPSVNHNRACELHEAHTGQWLTRSPEYISWKTLTLRALWIHGIPGAGKTVLFSHIVEDIRTCCMNDTAGRFGYAYYYCDFARGQDETEPLLRWVINQLSRQLKFLVPGVESLASDGGQPPISRLMPVFAAIVQKVARVFILVDALDESQNRERLVGHLLRIINTAESGNIQFLVVSRKEVDIERTLLPEFGAISLSNPYVDEDIRTHIHSRLREDFRLSRFPEPLKLDVEAALVKGAQGMFRWVVCQMDNLKMLNTEPEVRNALNELPKTLDETYERSLYCIPMENQIMARTTLHLLSSTNICNLEDLLEALSVDLDSLSYDPRNRPWDRLAPIEVCRCLVSYEPENDRIRLAHYTVKEFLISPRIGNGPASSFQISNDTLSYLEARCYLVYMQDLIDYRTSPRKLLSTLSGRWQSIAHKEEHKPDIQSLIISILVPANLQNIIEWMSWECEESFPEWSTGSDFGLPLMLTYLCYMDLYATTERFLTQIPGRVDFQCSIASHFSYSMIRYFIKPEPPSPTDSVESFNDDTVIERNTRVDKNMLVFGFEELLEQYVNDTHLLLGLDRTTVLHIAAGFRNERFLKLFVSQGAKVNSLSPNGFSVLTASIYNNYGRHFSVDGSSFPFSARGIGVILYFTKFLLRELGADPSSIGGCITPLQLIATLFPLNPEIYLEVAQELLAFGADPNGVTEDTMNQIRICDSSQALHRVLIQHYSSRREDPCQSLIPDLNKLIKKALDSRGKSKFYDTPLRTLESHQVTYSSNIFGLGSSEHRLPLMKKLEILLKSHGGKSLHLFPIKNLPGYCEEDMEIWKEMKGEGQIIQDVQRT